MGQSDILNFLKKAKKPLHTREISKGVGTGYSTTSSLLRKLHRLGEVSFEEIKTEGSPGIIPRYWRIVK